MSSSDIAVSVRGLSKAYHIAHNAPKHTTAAEALAHRIKHPFQRTESETFWALKDVEFDINKGDVVGIIGRNGAGKSTLLKILSRVTEPTAGRIDLYGRVGSLLEVGTGFHPELTGRENIYLNGAILGMSRREIARQFDAIVEFSGTEKFLDTPVKRYSSGMYVRLAFAVAAHLNPEILVVDEVLAVGDSEFQNKCIGKMRDVATSGRTVLFVSHNMQAISLFCTRGIVLHAGRTEYEGSVNGAIESYSNPIRTREYLDDNPEFRPGSGEYRYTSVVSSHNVFGITDDKTLRFRVEKRRNKVGKMFFSAHIVDVLGALVAHCDSRLVTDWFEEEDVLEGVFRFKTPWLKPGTYHADLYICSLGGIVDRYDRACAFDIAPVLPYPRSVSDEGIGRGIVLSDYSWEVGANLGPAQILDKKLIVSR